MSIEQWHYYYNYLTDILQQFEARESFNRHATKGDIERREKNINSLMTTAFYKIMNNMEGGRLFAEDLEPEILHYKEQSLREENEFSNVLSEYLKKLKKHIENIESV